ncbi:efflux RND transporter permease subunit [Thiomicrospira microaerophila]|uniref:efflux RND transporter permease subunit n=1 Tax=Thiomicrospira microaerophila TaxID=406020 RepID=UPI00200CE71D|nr:efflux RND transporter permease subunit [Thiomicrospira microaerophila]UQB42500.1 efflux RND transporter permease subunit [Thiomicrospira microaerophila]
MIKRFISNAVLANLVFALVLVIGTLSYLDMPRQKDPTINFNWIVIVTALPGASAEDIETRVTQPLEDGLRKLNDVNFISSTSRVGLSNILVRFRDLDDRTFDKRISDLRREIQNKRPELPADIIEPMVIEITSANAYPSATLVLKGQALDETLRSQGYQLKRELERLRGVDRIDTIGLEKPELQVRLDFDRLANLGLSPPMIADMIAAQWQDQAAGKLRVGQAQWLIRHIGQSPDPQALAQLPLPTPQGEVLLEDVAEILRARQDATQLVSMNDQPAIMLAVMKSGMANTLELVERLEDFIDDYNQQYAPQGLTLTLADDQTQSTRDAISMMQTNALQGLTFVLLVSWLFLGWRIGVLVAMAIPFSLTGVFIVLNMSGETLNLTVLLGVIIALGMLVDVAVVMIEAMHQQMHRGRNTLDAAIEAMREVGWPLIAAVLTTIAAFLPLMLLPGILGDFMRIVPLVVTIALIISLIQAFWMLPSQSHAMHLKADQAHHLSPGRERRLMKLRNLYGRALVKSFRHPWLTLLVLIATFSSAVYLVASERITTNFFASDTLEIFYLNVELPTGTPLDQTLAKTREVEKLAQAWLKPEEQRALVSYAGQMFTETEPLIGENYGQVFISLAQLNQRTADEIIDGLRDYLITHAPIPAEVGVLKLSGGPPSSKPISVKVRGDDYDQIAAAVADLTSVLETIPGIKDIQNDATLGSPQLVTQLNMTAISRAGLDPMTVVRSLRLLTDGEVVAQMNDRGEQVDLRVRGALPHTEDIQAWLATQIASPSGNRIALSELVDTEVRQGYVSLRHHNFSRAITLEADIDRSQIDTLSANAQLQQAWEQLAVNHPGINLDFSGELDEINESLNAMMMLFVMGVGLMYLILGAQFRSYFQPLIILLTIPMAFTGVAYGLWLSGYPLSLYTLYGVVALSGIAVNSAIVLISAANSRRDDGMSVLHAIVYAARRRLVPILITTFTTMAGLMGLAIGLGGHSLMFSPVATAIVWGIGVSTLLTLFTIPLIYRLTARSKISP